MKAFFHHLCYDFKTGIRDKTKLLMFYLFPLAYFFLVGGFMSQINPLFKDSMLPGMIMFAVMSAALLSLPGTLVQARESGVFRSFRINGVPKASILSIPVIGSTVHIVIVSAIMSVAGYLIFGGVPPTNIPGFILAGLISYVTYAGLGLLLGVVAGSANASVLLAQIIYIPSILLGGLMMPPSVLPEAFQRGALVLPASHGMILFKALGNPQAGQAFPWLSLAVLGGGAFLSFLLAGLLFQWDARSRQPNRKVFAALLAIIPYALALLIPV